MFISLNPNFDSQMEMVLHLQGINASKLTCREVIFAVCVLNVNCYRAIIALHHKHTESSTFRRAGMQNQQ